MIEQQIIEEARTWIGTPFIHQARLKYIGCDCIGLVWRVGEACNVLTVDPVLVKRYLAYGRQPNPRRMREALETFFVEIPKEEYKLGDIVWLEWRVDLPMHLAIISQDNERQTIIHALQEMGKVVEHGFTDEWQRRANSWWRFPGVANG